MNNKSTNLISISGSVASIIALIIVLVGNNPHDPQLAVLRVVFALIGILFTGGIIVFAIDYIKDLWKPPINDFRRRVVKTVLSGSASLVCLVISMDGVFAALYWRPWLIGLINQLRIW